MNRSVIELDLGERESVATYLFPDDTKKDQFSLIIDIDG